MDKNLKSYILVPFIFTMISLSNVNAQSLRMKCIWAYYSDKDTAYIDSTYLNKIIDIHISGNIIINGKRMRKMDDTFFTSKPFEIDYWLVYSDCVFFKDFTEMLFESENRGKYWYCYYTTDLNAQHISTKKEMDRIIARNRKR